MHRFAEIHTESFDFWADHARSDPLMIDRARQGNIGDTLAASVKGSADVGPAKADLAETTDNPIHKGGRAPSELLFRFSYRRRLRGSDSCQQIYIDSGDSESPNGSEGVVLVVVAGW
jgi:hypothetical protein